MSRVLTAIAVAAICGTAATPLQAQSPLDNYVPLTKEALANPAAGDWVMYRQNYQGWGYSPLDMINKDNVKSLTLAWSRVMEPGSNESTALEYNGVVFLGNAGDVIQALDAKNGDLLWEYRRQLPDRSTLNSITESKRSIALYDDKVYFISWDNFVVALDAKTGQLAFETDRGQGTEGASNSNGPIVVDGVVIAGSSCQYAGFGCFTTGHDAESGEELWRHNFIPRPGEPGDETWGGSPFEARWITGSWGGYTYDPELNLVYYGTTGVGPASEAQRGMEGATMAGTNTRYAVNPRSGEIVWSHQVLPRDNWDQECTYEAIIVDSPINPKADAAGMLAVGAVSGETRKVSTGVPCKTGIAWTFDAATGEFLWAKSTVEQNMVANIDNTGLVTVNEEVVMSDVTKTYEICPTYLGGRDWPTAAYSPKTNAFYVPLNNMCSAATAKDQEATPADSYNVDLTFKPTPGKENAIGRIDAISVETGETLWTYEQPAGLYSPVLATAGDLLFTGGSDRYFRALDPATGEVIWETRLPGQASGHATSWEVDGKQYIAIPAGGHFASGIFRPMSPDVDSATGSNALFVFTVNE